MAEFKVVLGDWSDDGHGKTDERIVVIEDRFPADELAANFKKNTAEFGVDFEEIAADYEDNSIPEEVALKLIAHGVHIYQPEGNGDTRYWVDADDLLGIIMFLFGHGLPNFHWVEKGSSIPVLVGGYGAIGTLSAGYGLFY